MPRVFLQLDVAYDRTVFYLYNRAFSLTWPRKRFHSRRIGLDTNMAAISLFWDTNMANVRSRENALHAHVNVLLKTVDLEFCLTIIRTSSFEEGLSRRTC